MSGIVPGSAAQQRCRRRRSGSTSGPAVRARSADRPACLRSRRSRDCAPSRSAARRRPALLDLPSSSCHSSGRTPCGVDLHHAAFDRGAADEQPRQRARAGVGLVDVATGRGIAREVERDRAGADAAIADCVGRRRKVAARRLRPARAATASSSVSKRDSRTHQVVRIRSTSRALDSLPSLHRMFPHDGASEQLAVEPGAIVRAARRRPRANQSIACG